MPHHFLAVEGVRGAVIGALGHVALLPVHGVEAVGGGDGEEGLLHPVGQRGGFCQDAQGNRMAILHHVQRLQPPTPDQGCQLSASVVKCCPPPAWTLSFESAGFLVSHTPRSAALCFGSHLVVHQQAQPPHKSHLEKRRQVSPTLLAQQSVSSSDVLQTAAYIADRS